MTYQMSINEGDKVMAIVDGHHKPATVLYKVTGSREPVGSTRLSRAYMLEIDSTGARGVFDVEHITDYHD